MKYTKRLKAPSTADKNYLHTSVGGYNSCIHIKKGSCLPNCVGYAWGRWRELLGKTPKLSRGNAENWYGYSDGYKRGSTPKVGAVICWRKGKAGVASDGAGHVAIVEEIKKDGTIITSNSGYGGSRFYLKTLKPPYSLKGYTLQGFIYLPIEFEENTPSFAVGDKVKLAADAVYKDGKKIPTWVKKSTLYVRGFHNDGSVIISILKKGAITGVVNKKYLSKQGK